MIFPMALHFQLDLDIRPGPWNKQSNCHWKWDYYRMATKVFDHNGKEIIRYDSPSKNMVFEANYEVTTLPLGTHLIYARHPNNVNIMYCWNL